MTTRGSGGRIAPDNRGPQAKGVGRDAKRHDLERRAVPFLHDSDLQQGDVEALESGQRIAPLQTQRGGGGVPQNRRLQTPSAPLVSENPSLNDIIQSKLGGTLKGPSDRHPADVERLREWGNWFRQMANSPGISPLLRGAMMSAASAATTPSMTNDSGVLDLAQADEGIDLFLRELGY